MFINGKRKNWQTSIRKISISLFATIMLSASATMVHAGLYPHINTYGFDYVRFIENSTLLKRLAWAAKRHDWVVGPTARWAATGVDYYDWRTYDTVKSMNKNGKVMKYLPYHSMAPKTQEWLENWCVKNGFDPEKLYYHYYKDTTIRLTNGKMLTVPGFGSGSAGSLEEARMRVRWNGGWVGINPSSEVFRKAYQALALKVISVKGEKGKYADGLFLDTFEGLVEMDYWSSHLENTIELKGEGGTIQVYDKARKDLVDSKIELEKFLKQKTGNSAFRLQVNAAEPDYAYHQHKDLYVKYKKDLMDISIEFLVTTTTNKWRIQRLQQIYDDLEGGRKFFIRSQTNYGPETDIPFSYMQFAMATHYLINHKNAHFFFHIGNAGNYGGFPYGEIRTTHWHKNIEYNIGKPVKNKNRDYWGKSGTDRFYIFKEENKATILAREYDKALVLAKFPEHGGFANIGKNSKTYPLNGKYRPLLADNKLGEVTTSVELGNSEGIILIKDK